MRKGELQTPGPSLMEAGKAKKKGNITLDMEMKSSSEMSLNVRKDVNQA